jgi:hypothetical protein
MLSLSSLPPSPMRGRTEVGGAFQVLHNDVHYSIDVLQNFIVPKSEDDEFLITKPTITLLVIISPFSVLSSVNFNDQSFLQAHKIDDVSSEWLLSAKFATGNLPEPKLLPEQLLSVGWIFP